MQTGFRTGRRLGCSEDAFTRWSLALFRRSRHLKPDGEIHLRRGSGSWMLQRVGPAPKLQNSQEGDTAAALSATAAAQQPHVRLAAVYATAAVGQESASFMGAGAAAWESTAPGAEGGGGQPRSAAAVHGLTAAAAVVSRSQIGSGSQAHGPLKARSRCGQRHNHLSVRSGPRRAALGSGLRCRCTAWSCRSARRSRHARRCRGMLRCKERHTHISGRQRWGGQGPCTAQAGRGSGSWWQPHSGSAPARATAVLAAARRWEGA